MYVDIFFIGGDVVKSFVIQLRTAAIKMNCGQDGCGPAACLFDYLSRFLTNILRTSESCERPPIHEIGTNTHIIEEVLT